MLQDMSITGYQLRQLVGADSNGSGFLEGLANG